MVIRTTLAVASTLCVLVVGCAWTNRASAKSAVQDTLAIPTAVIPGAIHHLRARVGDRFYRECISIGPNPQWITQPIQKDWGKRDQRLGSAWNVYFNLLVPSKPFVHGLVTVFVDSTGLPVEFFPITGIGACVEHPEECAFRLDEREARQIAMREGLEPGVRPWEANFVWNYGRGRYLWVIKNTLRVEPNGCDAGGHILFIDPVTETVDGKNKIWDVICN